MSDRRRRRRRAVALLLAVALIAPIVVAATALEAQQASVDDYPVAPEGERDEDFGWFVDTDTRTVTLADDSVRLDVGDDVKVHMRADATVRFKVCEYDADLDDGENLDKCQEPGNARWAGGTCGDAVAYDADKSKPPVDGHQHVVTVCAAVLGLPPGGLRTVGGAGYATVTAVPGAITGDYRTGHRTGGAIRVDGVKLGETVAEYCLTSLPFDCARWARLTILVEPGGWEDARVAGVADMFRLELDRSTGAATLFRNGVTDPVGRFCCLDDPDSWRITVRLPVLDNDEVIFYGGAPSLTPTGEPMPCLPRYCDGMAPGGLGDVEWVVRNSDLTLGLRVRGDSVEATLTSTGPFERATVRSSYCVRYTVNGCSESLCARSTYLGAPNDGVPDRFTYVPRSVYRATDLCPPHASVTLTVEEATPGDVDPPSGDDTEASTDPPPPEVPEPTTARRPWRYRPDPFPPSPLPANVSELQPWCYPGIGPAALPDHDGLMSEATSWIWEMYADKWPERGLSARPVGASLENWTILENLMAGDAPQLDPAGEPFHEVTWAWIGDLARQSQEIDPGTGLPATDPVTGVPTLTLANADDLAEEMLARYYETVLWEHWNRPEAWSGLVTSDYRPLFGVITREDHPFLPAGRRLVERRAAAGDAACLGTEPTIVNAWPAHPGLDEWGPGLCGVGVTPKPELVSPLAYFDHQCPFHPDWSDDDRLSRLAGAWVDWIDCPDDPRKPPGWTAPPHPGGWTLADPPCWTLGAAWEQALEAAAPCAGASGCDVWAPPVPGFYQVRLEIRKPLIAPVVPPEFEELEKWHEVWLKCRPRPPGSDACTNPTGWETLGGPSPPPITFDDLVWVAPLSLTRSH